MKDEPSHLSHVCFREPIHRSSFTVCFRERVHLSRKHTVKDEPIHLINLSCYRQHGIFHSRELVRRTSVPVKQIMMTRLMTPLCPSNGAVNRSREHKAVNGSRESIHAVDEI